MPDYIITARAVHGQSFGDVPGPSNFLEVPDDAAEITPAMLPLRRDSRRRGSRPERYRSAR